MTVRVTATVGGSATGAVTVAPDTLTYSTTTWNTGQAATLHVTEEHATLGSSAYTLALATEPKGPVTVQVPILATPGSGAVTAAPSNLTYSAASWNTAQTVPAGDDPNAVGKRVTLTHAVTSADPDYAGLESRAPAQVPAMTVEVTDGDTAGIAVSVTTLTIEEERSGTYTVALTAQPAGPVTVVVARAAGTPAVVDVTVEPGAREGVRFSLPVPAAVRGDGGAELRGDARLTGGTDIHGPGRGAGRRDDSGDADGSAPGNGLHVDGDGPGWGRGDAGVPSRGGAGAGDGGAGARPGRGGGGVYGGAVAGGAGTGDAEVDGGPAGQRDAGRGLPG